MAFDMVRISGKQLCNYIWCVNSPLNSSDENKLRDLNYEPSWTFPTELLVTFNDSLLAGNITSGESGLSNWKIYRQRLSDNKLELAAIIDKGETSFIDYVVQNKSEYKYSLFAEVESYITAPIESGKVTTNWDGWCLFSADNTEYQNELKFHEGFVFTINVNSDQINNNLVVGSYNNFTPYPKIQKSKTNYYSGILSSILAYIDCSDSEMHEDFTAEDRLKRFSTDPRRKFLRDYKGHLWEVEITSPIGIQPHQGTEEFPYDIQIGWTEIGSHEGVMITNLDRSEVV